MSRSLVKHQRLVGLNGLAGALCLLLQACSQAPLAPAALVTPSAPAVTPQALIDTTPATIPPVTAPNSPAEYRLMAARHVYTRHPTHLYSGPMPPLLQAVGVVDIEIGTQGEVRNLTWLRAPTHVPEVMRQIEQLIRGAAPYPPPLHVGSITYTDTWLWHHSGRFQLHTLSEGQLGESALGNTQEPKRRSAQRGAATEPTRVSGKCKQPTSVAGQVSAYC